MKKLLTVLLTLVMAVCLVNINSSHTKAKDENDNPIQLTDTLVFTNHDWGGYGPGIGWYIGGWQNKITDSSTPSFSDLGMIYVEGVGGEPGTVTFTKSLTCNASLATIEIDYPINIEFGGDGDSISIINTSDGNGITNSENLIIDGGNKKVEIVTNNGTAFTLSNHLTLKNIELECRNKAAVPTLACNDLTLDNNSVVEAINGNKSAAALKVDNSNIEFLPDESNKVLFGNDAGIKTAPPVEVERRTDMGFNGTFCIKGKDSPAPYVKASNVAPSPTPTPSPSKKDESCEKVIGPTWHWNNDKGICEEYATVGTSTR